MGPGQRFAKLEGGFAALVLLIQRRGRGAGVARGEKKVASNINSPPSKPKTSVATPDLPILRVHEVVHGIEKQSNAD